MKVCYKTRDGQLFDDEAEARIHESKLDDKVKFIDDVYGIAYQYNQWLERNNAGSTYTTFCDDFGCTHSRRSDIYDLISRIRALVNRQTTYE